MQITKNWSQKRRWFCFCIYFVEVDINNDGEIDASSEYIELLINAGQATLTGDRISSTTSTEFNQLSNSGYTLDGTVIKNSSVLRFKKLTSLLT